VTLRSQILNLPGEAAKKRNGMAVLMITHLNLRAWRFTDRSP
jgi:ABC-type microcin C transport system duplicated ATPase subunit YejF